MNVSKTLFAQVMDCVPWKTFGRIIDRHTGDAGVRTFDCSDLFRVMAFAELTWRESLRDIETCLTANQSKSFHMRLKTPPARSTLADARNARDWRIYNALPQRLIARAGVLYAHEPSVLKLDASVYTMGSTTISLCLRLFDWAPLRSTKAAIRLGPNFASQIRPRQAPMGSWRTQMSAQGTRVHCSEPIPSGIRSTSLSLVTPVARFHDPGSVRCYPSKCRSRDVLQAGRCGVPLSAA